MITRNECFGGSSNFAKAVPLCSCKYSKLNQNVVCFEKAHADLVVGTSDNSLQSDRVLHTAFLQLCNSSSVRDENPTYIWNYELRDNTMYSESSPNACIFMN